jgi:hypothetical protein
VASSDKADDKTEKSKEKNEQDIKRDSTPI